MRLTDLLSITINKYYYHRHGFSIYILNITIEGIWEYVWHIGHLI
jgi:hypothetical protein